MKKSILNILIILLVIVFCVSGWQVFRIVSEYKEGENSYDELNQFIVVPEATQASKKSGPTEIPDLAIAGSTALPSATAGPGTAGGEGSETTEDENRRVSPFTFPEVDFEALKAINPDVVGWIYIPGTEISYPVMQAEDNEYYLHRLMNRKGNGSGSIFMDYRCDPELWDTHTILYGHHMNNGSMFAKLMGYKRQAFYEEHKVFQLMTPETNFQMEVIAAYVSRPDWKAWDVDFETDEDVKEWIEAIMRRSAIDTGYTYTPGDQFVTLSTCTYEYASARFLVVGVIRWE